MQNSTAGVNYMPIFCSLRFSSSTVLLLAGSCGFLACAKAQGNKLERGTALGVLRKAGIKDEITVELHTQLAWDESLWGGGKFYEQARQRVQPELDFRNLLVEAGVFRKKPNQILLCVPQAGYIICQDRQNVLYNFEGIPSPNLRVGYPGMIMNGRSMEFAVLVLAKAANPKITGITQEGIEASVEFEFGYSPTDLYKRVFPLMRDALAKCPPPPAASAIPNLVTNNPAPSYCGHWPSEVEIGGRRDKGSAQFKRYDDGWRIITEEN